MTPSSVTNSDTTSFLIDPSRGLGRARILGSSPVWSEPVPAITTIEGAADRHARIEVASANAQPLPHICPGGGLRARRPPYRRVLPFGRPRSLGRAAPVREASRHGHPVECGL